MPKAGFKDTWDTVKSGKYWEGYVRNMAKKLKNTTMLSFE